jgi:hypothetical protein
MLEIIIPGRGRFTPEVLVLDYNGTLLWMDSYWIRLKKK